MQTFAPLLGRLNRSRAVPHLYRTRLQYSDIALGFSRWRVNLARERFMRLGRRCAVRIQTALDVVLRRERFHAGKLLNVPQAPVFVG
jgi:hypothetical protein